MAKLKIDFSHYYCSEYEGIKYYMNERKCEVGDLACVLIDSVVVPLRIIHIICRSDNPQYYDALSKDVLLKGKTEYKADYSAEFITDNDCYLVWFNEEGGINK